jgi:hypothetical protein
MKIVGCDRHAKQQTIAMVDTETGEFTEKTLVHEGFLVSAGMRSGAGDGVPCSSSLVLAFLMPHLRLCPCKLCRRQVVQRTVWTLFVVILPPGFDLSPCVASSRSDIRPAVGG